MNLKYPTLIATIAAAFAAQGVLAGSHAKKWECYDEAVMPKAKSVQSRAAVKAQISGKEYSCYEEVTEPMAESAKDRGAVKDAARAAMKAGELPSGEASPTPMPKK